MPTLVMTYCDRYLFILFFRKVKIALFFTLLGYMFVCLNLKKLSYLQARGQVIQADMNILEKAEKQGSTNIHDLTARGRQQ